jgi:hypothetical protein
VLALMIVFPGYEMAAFFKMSPTLRKPGGRGTLQQYFSLLSIFLSLLCFLLAYFINTSGSVSRPIRPDRYT